MPVQYSDLSHTLFPQAIDDKSDHALMTDVTADTALLTAANQYSTRISQGDIAGAESLIKSTPRLADAIFNADKYNWMRDAILAIQKYYMDDVHDTVTAIGQHAIGIDDDNSEGAPSKNGYSISKIMSLIRGTQVPVDASAGSGLTSVLQPGVWGGTMPHTYQISIPGITADDNIDVALDPTATEAQAKAWSKAMVLSASQSANSITLNAYGKITSNVNIPIIIRVHN